MQRGSARRGGTPAGQTNGSVYARLRFPEIASAGVDFFPGYINGGPPLGKFCLGPVCASTMDDQSCLFRACSVYNEGGGWRCFLCGGEVLGKCLAGKKAF